MTDYTINIGFDDNNASKKLDDLDKKVKEVTKPAKLDIKLPDLDQLKKNLQDLSKYSGLAVTAFKQFTPVGQSFAAVSENAKALSGSLANVSRILGNLSVYLNPVRGLADGFGSVTTAVQGTIDTTARLGFAIFGITQSVNVLKSAFGQMFEDTVGREIQLRDQILQTATTLAGTNRVFADGFEIKDPVEKLKALEGTVNKSIDRIRDRSLEIAGTTSEAMISVFNIVASQIGSFGGTMQQAEDLAAKFSGALGTLGMSDPGYARQEISSVMMGNIGPDSVLAKTIGISNPDMQRARQQGKVYEYLTEKLAVFEAGQKTASKGFRGVTSNIEELSQELKRSFGAALLDPLLKRISAFYDKVSGKETIQKLKDTARAFGQLVGGSLNTAVGTVAGSSIFKGFSSKGVEDAASKLQNIFAKISVYIQNVLSRIAPSIERVVNRVGQSVGILGKAFAEMAVTLGRVKIDQLVVRLQALTALTPGIVVAANAYAEYLQTIQDIVNTPLGRYINEVKEMNKVLSEFGVFGVVNNIIAIRELKQQIPILVSQIQAIGAAIGQAAQTAFTFMSNLYSQIASATIQAIAAIEGPVVGAFSKISLGLARIAAQAAQFALTLSNVAVIIGGQWTTLSAPLASLANGLAGIATALAKAGLSAAQFGAEVQAAMTRAQTSTQNASNSINAFGVRLKTGVQAGATAAAGALTGLVRGFLATMTTMALWTAGLTLVFDTIRRIGEWWERFSQQQEYKQAVDDLNSGLLDQVKAATAAGKALDSVTEARKRLREEALQAQIAQDESALKELAKELYKRTKNIEALRRNFPAGSPGATGPDSKLTNEQYVFKRDPGFAKELKEVEERLKNANKLLRQLRGEPEPTNKKDPQLGQQENRQQIEELAKFEKDTRRSIEDEVYNYRKQAQQKELEFWRLQGEIRIQQIDLENRRVIEGADSEARASLEALATFISTKRKGELDIEAKKKEAQMAAAELERAVGRFRLQLEQQLAEIRKRVNQYDIDVLDKRIKAEQLIANIRNNAIVWDPPNGSNGGGSGQFRVGSTGRSTGPHLHIGGSSADKVVEEALTIIKAWQNMGIEYIKLSNIRTDVKAINDDTKLRALIRREMAAHSFRSGSNPVDIAVPAGTPLPVAHGPVTWGGADSGYRATSTATGNFFLHGLKPQPSANGNSSSASASGNSAGKEQAAMQFFMSKGLSRMQAAAMVGGLMQESNGLDPTRVNPSTGAEGIAQWKDSRKYAMIQAGARNNFEKQLNFVWTELMSSENNAYVDLKNSKTLNEALMAAAKYERFRGYRQLGSGGEWGNRIQYTKDLLANTSNTGSNGQAAPGNASLATIGGPPQRPSVTLNIDTSTMDAALDNLKRRSTDVIDAQKQLNEYVNTGNWDAYVRSLNTTNTELEKASKELRNQSKELEVLQKASEGGIYDPDVLEQNVKYQQGLLSLEALRRNQLKGISEMSGLDAATRKKAEEEVSKAYNKNKEALKETVKLSTQRLNIDKQIERIKSINNEARQSISNFEVEKFRLESEARSALFDPSDFVRSRTEQALQTINTKQLELTNNGKDPMSDALKQAFDRYAAIIIKQSEELAALDKVLEENKRLRELENDRLQESIQGMSTQASLRTEAAKSALDPSNYQASRRLDAELQVYNKFLELSKGDTRDLTDAEKGKLQQFAEQALKNADTLAKLDKELKDFSDRLAFARESAQAITEGYKGLLLKVINGGNTKEAIGEMSQNMASFFTGKLLDYAFKPLQDQFENMFKGILNVDDKQLNNTNALKDLTAKIQELITAIDRKNSSTELGKSPSLPATVSDTAIPGPPPATDAAGQLPAAANQAAEAVDKVNTSITKLGKDVPKAADTVAQGTNQTLGSMQRYTAGLATVATSALAMAGGLQMMKKGGTYNTLMGLASIFGSLSSFTGMFGKGGIFARASGGPVSAHTPYLVGERGPELFMPGFSGQIIPNDRTRGMFADTREALTTYSRPPEGGASSTAIATPAPIDVRYEAQVINNVEYVTAEQHRKGMQEAARRGQLLAYQGIQHSVKVRRRLGF